MNLLVVSHAAATPLNQQLYAELMRKTGWHVTLVVPRDWRDEYGQTLRHDRWPAFEGRLIGIPVRSSGNIIFHSYRTSFARLIRELDPDAIYVNHEPYAVATAQVYWGASRAGHRSRPIGFYSCQNIAKRYPLPFRWTEAWVLRSSAFAFPISREVDGVFRRKGYRGPSTVLPLALDGNLYRPRDDSEATRRSLGVGAGEVVFGYVGRFVPEKGLTTLLDAFARVSDPNVRLALIGAGPMEGELRRRVATLQLNERVTFVGFVAHTEMPRLFSALDALVLPSETQANWREQFGRVLLESMACGTPAIGSDSGEIPNLIHATGGGLVFRERDATDLATQLRLLASDPDLRKSLAEAGRVAVGKRYTIERVVNAFTDAILAAVSTAGASPKR